MVSLGLDLGLALFGSNSHCLYYMYHNLYHDIYSTVYCPTRLLISKYNRKNQMEKIQYSRGLSLSRSIIAKAHFCILKAKDCTLHSISTPFCIPTAIKLGFLTRLSVFFCVGNTILHQNSLIERKLHKKC